MASKKKSKADPHLAAAAEYCRSVIAGETPAGRMATAACQRQVSDLARQKTEKAWIYRFDEATAGKICRFIEQLPHVKGDLAGTPIHLEPWQCFMFSTAFGWVNKKTGRRRFRRASIFVPRGNAKSTCSSGVALYCLAADGEGGAEVYSAATTRDQARIVFGDAQQMMRKAPAVRDAIGVEVSQHAVFQASTGSRFVPLSREADNLDGLNIHCAVVDEIHAHKTREILDVLETGTGKRSNSLLWIISTAGSDTSGIGYEVYTYARKVLEGSVKDDSQFAVIWEADPEDDWSAPETWRKANPNWGVSVRPEVVAQLAAKAQQLPAAQSTFLTKHLNRWVNADQAWMDMRAWDRAADAKLDENDFAGDDCFVGLDLASKVDIAAKVKLYCRDEPDPLNQAGPTVRHYYAFLDCYLPEAAVQEARNSQYGGWALEGRVKTSPGDVTDFGMIKADILADHSRLRLREVAYDPWQATQLAQELIEAGIVAVEMPANARTFSAPMKELDALVRSGRFHHDGNPAYRWQVSNVVCHTDAKENVYPRKQRAENKIDGVVATIMALGRAMVAPTGLSTYETRGVLSL